MNARAWRLLSVVAMAALSAVGWAQNAEYPITVIAPGKGPYTFPPGYQTPWDKIAIRVTAKMSPKDAVPHRGDTIVHSRVHGVRSMSIKNGDDVMGCSRPIDAAALADYWLAALAGPEEESVEESRS